jgi:pyruvate,orthophosphate dikinase
MSEAGITVRGVGASPGVATGEVVFQAKDAIAVAAAGRPVILVRIEASTEDVPGIQSARGVVCTRGGLTGDAAVVARALGRPCVVGFAQVTVLYAEESMRVVVPGRDEPVVVRRGDTVTVDGAKGTITIGASS